MTESADIPSSLGEPVKKPSPALTAEEQTRWKALEEAFDDDALHKQYVGFCLRNSLLVQATRRYNDYAQDQNAHTVEQRRIARHWGQQLSNILFAKPARSSLKAHREGVFGTMSYPEQAGLLFGAILFVGGLMRMGGAYWWLAIMSTAVGAGAIGWVFFRKIRDVREKIER
jgi:hypothetical protein